MKQPETYNASAVSVEVMPQPPPETQEPRIEDDPLTAFENYHYQVQADLRGWMTFAVDDRIRRLELFTKDSQTFKLDEARRRKALCYVIFMEAHHSLGERKVAARAFVLLFGAKD